MIELFGIISTVLAIIFVIGAKADSRRFRWCFLIWLVSNALSLAVHAQAAIWSLAVRDVIFLALAYEGWIKWKKT